MTRKTPVVAGKSAALPAGYAGIHRGIVELLDAARQAAARSVNALMTASFSGRPRGSRALGRRLAIFGCSNSQIATLAERQTRYVMLVRVAGKDTETGVSN